MDKSTSELYSRGYESNETGGAWLEYMYTMRHLVDIRQDIYTILFGQVMQDTMFVSISINQNELELKIDKGVIEGTRHDLTMSRADKALGLTIELKLNYLFARENMISGIIPEKRYAITRSISSRTNRLVRTEEKIEKIASIVFGQVVSTSLKKEVK